MTKVEKQIRELIKQYEATGRVATIHPRKKTVCFDGFKVLNYKEAKKRILSVIKGD